MWRTLCIFSMAILLLIGALQILLIKPYYRNDRIETIEYLTSVIEHSIILNPHVTSVDVNDSFNSIVNNNVCAIILNEKGKIVYESDALGVVCAFNSDINLDGQLINIDNDSRSLINLLKNESDIYSSSLISDITDKEMLLYGKRIKADLDNYYLFINSPLEPVESVVNFFMGQFFYIALFVLIISLFVSLMMANRISRPIEKIKNSANKLAEGDYDVDFEVKSFEEINELSVALNDATDKLSKIDELRKDLIANISHDIKTPLTMIKAYSEMIRDISGNNEEKRNQHLSVIMKEVDYLTRLVNDMAELSKMQAGYIQLTRQNFDMLDVINDAIAIHGAMLSEHHIDLRTKLTSSIVWADEIKMKQVVSNFISNAIKYSDDGSIIEIIMQDSEDKLRVEIKDHGHGIKEEDLPYIWDRYFKIDKKFSRNIKSTGLGLAIVRAILENHGAKYGVNSKVGEGSTFYFELSKDYENTEDEEE